ncbi:MAG: hypothetical protein HUU35_19150, partial [Armatimonadetes bacterium]|nr:hypothetical protein [Armatimonadota bacterium]
VLPRLLDIRLGDSAAGLVGSGPEAATLASSRLNWRRTLATNAFVPVRDLFQATLSWARNYHLSGDRRHLEAFRVLWRELLDSPAPLVRNEMEWIFKAVEAWDLVEEDPALTDAERLEITQRLLTIGCVNEAKYGRNVQNTNRLIADGHQLDQALCLYLHGLYFDRYYGINGHWMTMSKPLIDLAENAPRVHDSYAYGPIIGDSFMSEYALKTGNFGYFEKSSGKQAADWVLLCSDNLGRGGTFGDDGAWTGSVPLEFLSKCWGFYGDDRLLWPLQGRRPPLGCFATDRPAARPDDLLGVASVPLHELLYRTALQQIADPSLRAVWQPESVLPAQAFDKLAFRGGFAPEDQYLLLDGLSTIPHGHRDGASILRFTDNNRLFLTEGHYIEIAKERHNTLAVSRDGVSGDPPPLVALEGSANGPGSGLARLLSSAYNGVDWRRDIAWVAERFFVVVDTVTAREPGDYAFTLHWQTLGEARLQDGALRVEQDGEPFTIANLDGAELTLTEELHRLGSNYYASYPHSRDGLVKHLKQTRYARLAAGEQLAMVNVLWTDQAVTPALADGKVTITTAGGPWQVECGGRLTLRGPDGELSCGQPG